MSIIKTDAILLKKRELRETSFLLDFYTRESGKIRGVIKGVRSPAPQFGANYEVFTLDRIVFYEKKNKDIFIISQCELVDFFPGLRNDLERLGYAFYYAELIDSAVEPGQKNTEIFDVLVETLKALSGPASAKRVTRVFEIRLLKALGIMPSLKVCINCGKSAFVLEGARFSLKGGILCGGCFKADPHARPILAGTINFIEHVAGSSLENLSRFKVSSAVGREVENILREFIDYHLGKPFKTVKFMQEVGVL